ncbi:MAG: transcriptional repressor [Planctomycetes bacterium]|nr:transcriptional repressor [Planctomycetota bacterium]
MRPAVALQRFEEYLRTRNLRVTQPRREVLELAWSTHDHFSADLLHQWVMERDLTPSRATVYRTLQLLVDGGFLGTLQVGGQVLYEHVLGHRHHDHIICVSCGRIDEFHCQEIEDLQEKEAQHRGYRLLSHTLTMKGRCGACQRVKARQSPSPTEQDSSG